MLSLNTFHWDFVSAREAMFVLVEREILKYPLLLFILN